MRKKRKRKKKKQKTESATAETVAPAEDYPEHLNVGLTQLPLDWAVALLLHHSGTRRLRVASSISPCSSFEKTNKLSGSAFELLMRVPWSRRSSKNACMQHCSPFGRSLGS